MAILQVGGVYMALTFFVSLSMTVLLVKVLPRKDSKPPCYGGIAIFAAFWVGFFTMYPLLLWSSPQWNMFIASLVVLITGVIDDSIELRPWQKTVGILIGAHVIYFNTDLTFSSNLIAGVPSWLSTIVVYLATIGWIYFVTNAINLLDGLDGLAASVSVTSLTTLAIMTYISSLSIRTSFLMMLVLLVVAILGFLPFNWYPARIYLGDTGALFIGFIFATLSVFNLKNVSVFSLIIPILVYAVPLFDTSYAIVRRFLKGKSMVERDEDHLHHRLLRQGFSVTQVVGLMILITIIFSAIALFSQLYRTYRSALLALSVVLIIILTVVMTRMDKNS